MRRMGPMGSAGMPIERSQNLGISLRRLLGLLRPERVGFAAVVVLTLVSVALSVLGPKVLGHGTDIIVSGLTRGGPGAIDFDALHRTLLLVAGLYAGGSVLSYSQGFILAGVVQRRMNRLRADVETKLHRLPLGYVDRQPRGDLLSRVTNDMDNLAQSLQQTLSQMLTSVLTLVGTVVMMFVVSWLLALIALITIPLSISIIAKIAGRAQSRFKAQWEQTGRLNALVEETFTGHNVVKAFGGQAEVNARFEQTNELLHDASFSAQFISGSTQPSMMAIGSLNFVLVAVVGGIRVASGALTLGAVQAFIQYSRQFSQPLTQVAAMVNVFQSGVASAERIFEFLDAAEEPAEGDTGATLAVRGKVEFDHVSFAYDPDRPLITDLSFVAQPGQTVAIVGPTGAGKTTLVNLIMRFYDLDGGRILLDGVDIATLARRELRSRIGMVLQDTWLFEGTIRENIAYGNPSASDDHVLAAARATYVDRFVRGLPAGYDTRLSDDDGALSAGEKQLLTIARTFLADPMILILDEATSSVDTRTEVLVQEAMAALRARRTSFVIAHRLSTIRDADIILVMEDGHIVEQGNHRDLLDAGGAYAQLYQTQFAAPIADRP
ncbi:MAG TPA: ABC transporter ATP-binding protein [Acidimicrobiia bacterium]|nr:ABC transporter ATP-binding protein [Acidimicrobiia bacterium]